MRLDRLTLIIAILVAAIVLPTTYVVTQQVRHGHEMAELKREFAQLCAAYNDQRDAPKKASTALIKISAESPPEFFTDHDRLLLTQFVQRANRELETQTPPETCAAVESAP